MKRTSYRFPKVGAATLTAPADASKFLQIRQADGDDAVNAEWSSEDIIWQIPTVDPETGNISQAYYNSTTSTPITLSVPDFIDKKECKLVAQFQGQLDPNVPKSLLQLFTEATGNIPGTILPINADAMELQIVGAVDTVSGLYEFKCGEIMHTSDASVPAFHGFDVANGNALVLGNGQHADDLVELGNEDELGNARFIAQKVTEVNVKLWNVGVE